MGSTDGSGLQEEQISGMRGDFKLEEGVDMTASEGIIEGAKPEGNIKGNPGQKQRLALFNGKGTSFGLSCCDCEPEHHCRGR